MKINSRTGCYQYWAFRAALGYERGRGKRSRKNDFEQGRHFTFLPFYPFYLFTLLPFYLLFLYARGVMPERCLKKLVRALWSLKLRWVAISPMVMSE